MQAQESSGSRCGASRSALLHWCGAEAPKEPASRAVSFLACRRWSPPLILCNEGCDSYDAQLRSVWQQTHKQLARFLMFCHPWNCFVARTQETRQSRPRAGFHYNAQKPASLN